jgi:hypothetical protein
MPHSTIAVSGPLLLAAVLARKTTTSVVPRGRRAV